MGGVANQRGSRMDVGWGVSKLQLHVGKIAREDPLAQDLLQSRILGGKLRQVAAQGRFVRKCARTHPNNSSRSPIRLRNAAANQDA